MDTNLSSLIGSLCVLKARKKELELVLKDTEKEIAEQEKLIFAAMDEQGVKETANTQAKISIVEKVYPQVQSWDLFGTFILDNRWLHLLEKRPAVLAYRELLTLNRPVPGVLPFTKRNLTFKEMNDES